MVRNFVSMQQGILKKSRNRLMFLVVALIFGLSLNVFAQPDQKLMQANQAYLEGERLAEEKNIDSYNKALLKFRTAKNLYKETNNINGEGKASLEMGVVLQTLGKYAEALEEHKTAYKLFGKIQRKIQQAQAANYIGVIYSTLGQKKLAFQLYNHAVRLFFETKNYEPNSFYYAIEAINNVGDMYLAFGDKKNAKFYYELGLPHVRAENDKNREAMILQNLGQLYLKFGEPQKAFEYYKQALTLLESTDFEEGRVRALNNIGLNAFRIEKKQDSVNYFNRALSLNSSRFKGEEALTLHYLLSVWKEIGNQNLAIFYGKQAVNRYQELRKSIRTLDPKVQKFYLSTIENTYRQLADLLIEQENFAQAEQVLRMLKEEEYFDFVRRDRSESSTLDVRVKLNETEKNLLKKYTQLSNQTSEIERQIAEIKKGKRRLSDLEKDRIETLKLQLEKAKAKLNKFLENDLVIALGKKTKEGITYDRSLQAKLKKWGEGTVTLYTVLAKDRYRVILTTPDKQIDGKTEISAVELNKKVFEYRKALQNIEVDPRPLGKELYDILIKPIEKELVKANAKTLVWSLDGTLRYIPIATLSPDGETYLVEKYRNVVTTPKTRDDVSDSNTEWLALGVGVSEPQTVKSPENPQEAIQFDPIPGTKRELMTIIRDENQQNENGILRGRRFLDRDFTLNSLSESLRTKNTKGKRKFTAVHIASHFQLGSNWANSFLLLGNGQILTLKDLKNSPEMDFGDVELVTLSACDTAFTSDSNGKEVDSLASVIQAKNGKAVLAALWAVADESTPLLMSEFYRFRKENPKMTKAEAMQKVQQNFVSGTFKPSREYIQKLDTYYKELNKTSTKSTFKFDKNAPFAHPYFWSPFVLIGNWR